jgi:ABC-type polysaccharide/polyol phosphate transport system ATPase subunit
MNYRLPTQKVDNLKEFVIRALEHKLKYRVFNVLDDISLKIYRGESIAIVGRNGVGKSTLLRIIAGIIPPSAGKVTVNGSMVPMLNIGAGFDANATGRENVFLNGAILGYTRKEMEKKYRAIVEFAELEEFMNVPIKNYSSGMQSRLGFAIAVNSEPDIILVDEILAVGDAKFQLKCRDKMKELQDSGVTFVVVSHSKGSVQMLCNRAILIKDRKIYIDGDIDTVYAEYDK